MKSLLFLLPVFALAIRSSAQPTNCVFSKPVISIDFGTGIGRDVNSTRVANYYRVPTSCPSDGHYAYASSTRNCFNNDWHTLTADHTEGDADGNMLLVNGAYSPGVFLETTITGLEGGAIYEFGVWLMNLCKPTYKCPFPLLPNISIGLETVTAEAVGKFATGNLPRVASPHWTQYRAYFTMPASMTTLVLVMANSAPGGCGNDFALDDITFRKCIKTTSKEIIPKKAAPATVAPKTVPPKVTQSKRSTPRLAAPKATTPKSTSPAAIARGKQPATRSNPMFPPPPLILTTRENPLAKRIESEAGEIKIQVYDNGEIDGDTVSIYHNNSLVKAHAGLSGNPISFVISVDQEHPHHELTMVADNLGSIPPNTSVMIITAGGRRYEVFISSNDQKNARVILDLKQ